MPHAPLRSIHFFPLVLSFSKLFRDESENNLYFEEILSHSFHFARLAVSTFLTRRCRFRPPGCITMIPVQEIGDWTT
jgi:hypothetical protein